VKSAPADNQGMHASGASRAGLLLFRDRRRVIQVVMSMEPIRIEYDLTRRQRLIPHLGIWAPFVIVPIGAVTLGLTLLVLKDSAPVLPCLAVGCILVFVFLLFMARGFLMGMLNIALIPTQHMDIVIEEETLGFMTPRGLYRVFLDGITSIHNYDPGTWTVVHYNGTVINIPVPSIAEQYIEHMRRKAEHGKTPEGVQALIERGRRIAEIEAKERHTNKKERT
jgi:hypothetical protein